MLRLTREVEEKLGWYVYRLIDPRNGETFYVGKGRGKRLFAHLAAADQDLEGEDKLDLKVQRIKEIQAAGLDVQHVVHRHGIATPEIAYEIEAALIDAYPGLANTVTGHHADSDLIRPGIPINSRPRFRVFFGRHSDQFPATLWVG